MATFMMFGKYTAESLQKVSADRTKKIADMISKCGGEVKEIYAVLGQYDLVFIADFPGNKEAVKASVAVGKSTGIGLMTCPAFTAQEYDKLVAEA